MIVSKPVVPAPPAEAAYPVDKLNLFPRLTRASYQDLYGVQPPPWDPARRTKCWFDTSVLDNFKGDPDHEIALYEVFDPESPTGTRPMAITIREAISVNLAGAYIYPAYTVAPTKALQFAPDSIVGKPVNAELLCLRADAIALATEIGAAPGDVLEIFPGGLFTVDWTGEPRRSWAIYWKGEPHHAAALLRQKYAKGVGAPGSWDLQGTMPLWVPARVETGEQDSRLEVPVPMRRLFEYEKLAKNLFSGWLVQRKDLTPPSTDDLLMRIEQRIAAIATHLGV